jgi:hypothetical protein
MPFVGDNIPTVRLTFPDNTVRYVQVPEDRDLYPAVEKAIRAEKGRFTGRQQIRAEVISFRSVNGTKD